MNFNDATVGWSRSAENINRKIVEGTRNQQTEKQFHEPSEIKEFLYLTTLNSNLKF
jgi:hypothetical protein